MSKENSNLTALNVFVSIVTLSILVFTIFDVDNSFSFNDVKFRQILYVILGAMVVTVIVNWNAVNIFINKQASRIKRLNVITFEYRKGFFEILDKKGKQVVYTEDCLIKRIKRKFLYQGKITCDGSINKSIQTFNCYSSLNNKNDELIIVYGKKRKHHSDSIVDKRQLQFGFAIKIHKGFMNNEEYWDNTFTNYTRMYDLKMSFPKKRPPKYVDIYQIKQLESGEIKLISMPIDPLIIEKKKKTLVKIKLLHLEKNSKFRVVWKW